MAAAGSSMLLWQFALTLLALGLDANVAIELILMIANTQTLGVPIRYASLPGTLSASFGILLIPSLGVLVDRWGKSKRSKAKILGFTLLIQFAGTACVLAANASKMLLEMDDSGETNITGMLLNDSVAAAAKGNRSAIYTHHVMAGINTTTLNSSGFPAVSFIRTVPLSSWLTHQNDSPSSQSNTPLPSALQLSTITTATPAPLESGGEQTIRFYAYLAMLGYCLLDCGYDASSCFLKTFMLHCTPAEFHVSVIVKSIILASLGGVLVSVLGSVDLGDLLTTGTGYDSSAALVCLLAALALTLLVIGAASTLTTGFCWLPPSLHSTEKAPLITSSLQYHELTSSQSLHAALTSQKTREKTRAHVLSSTSTIVDSRQAVTVADAVRPTESRRPGIVGSLQAQREMILVCMVAFFMMSAVYALGVFSVNFVGMGIFGGDPGASSDSEDYQRYQDGVAVGSQGTLIYYATFAVSSVFHEQSLALLGWKIEGVVVSAIFSILCLTLALTPNIWLFYVTTVWTGVFRAVGVSLPYILANQISAQQNEGESSGIAIAVVAAMLPCGFLVCSALMGPLIDATGNPATSMYYCAVCACLAAISVGLLRC